jgi:hypothetical protein
MCGRKHELNSDQFIEKYNNTDFSFFIDVFISIRSSTETHIIYFIHQFGGNEPGYFVTYSLLNDSISEINKEQLLKANVKDYFTDDEIGSYINEFRKYDFFLLGVDKDSNVFINPYKAQSPPYFLRTKELKSDDTLRMGYVYDRYKSNWYTNRTK